MEACYGCSAKAEQHPIVAVMNKKDVKKGASVIPNPDANSQFVGVPVCKECHVDPKHRKAHEIKGHFFPRERQTRALVMAGSDDLGMS